MTAGDFETPEGWDPYVNCEEEGQCHHDLALGVLLVDLWASPEPEFQRAGVPWSLWFDGLRTCPRGT